MTASAAAAAVETTDDGADAERQALEARARRMGWRPKDEYRGPSDNWVDADTFISRTEAEAPFLRERNRFLDDQLVKQQRETARLAKLVEDQTKFVRDNIGEIVNRGRRAEAGAWERQRKALKERMKAAYKAGEDAEGDRLSDELDELEAERPAQLVGGNDDDDAPSPPKKPEREKPLTEADVEQMVSPTVKAWVSRNKWFETNPKMSQKAVALHTVNIQGGMSEASSLEDVETQMRALHPELFENARREVPSSVDRPAPAGGSKPKTGKTVNDLPDEAKRALADIKRKFPGFTDEMYLKEYKW